MINFSIDKKLNFILIKIAGQVSRDETTKAISRFNEIASEMAGQFYVITDLSNYQNQNPDDFKLLNHVHNKLIGLLHGQQTD